MKIYPTDHGRYDLPSFRREYPPMRDRSNDQCIKCKSQALLLPSDCRYCGEAVCKICEGEHIMQHRDDRDRRER